MATIARLVVKIIADADEFARGLGDAQSRVSSFTGNVQKLGKVAIGGLVGGLGMAAGAAGVAGLALGKMALDAAPVEQLSAAFQGLAEASGRSADDLLVALEKGSGGMIAQRDLMQSYNMAAQLVSQPFADQLPDAMGYLSKVAAATGQDMGFMLDSLVRGVGRLSPMILDNLAIQVSLEEASAAAAEMFGVEESALTKAQQQAGMMNVVMAKLAANTAAMPDVAGSAAAGVAQMQAGWQNFKDQAGGAVLPILSSLMGTLGGLTDRVLPTVVGFLEGSVVPVVERVAEGIRAFVAATEAGLGPLDALKYALWQALPQELVTRAWAFIEGIRELITRVQEALAPVMAWMGSNVELQDVLMALGIAIASVVIPAIVGVVTSIAPIIAAGMLLVAAIAAVRQAWETDFGGIRTALETAWATMQPIFQQVIEWLQTNIPIAIQALSDLWTYTLLPAIEAVWGFIQDSLIPLFSALADVGIAAVSLALEVLAGLWQNMLQPAFVAIYAWLKDKLSPMFKAFMEKVAPLESVFRNVAGWIQRAVDWLGRLADKLRSINLPDWLTPGSPTPFELGLRGIAEAMAQITRASLPALGMGLAGLPMGVPAAAGVAGMGGGGTSFGGGLVINIYGARGPEASADAVIRALRDRGMLPQTAYR